MSEPVTLHSAQDYVLTFDSVTLQGFSDGEAIGVEAPSEIVKSKVGAYGEVAISITKNPVHLVTVKLFQSSAMNARLRSKYLAQLAGNPSTQALKIMSLQRLSTGETWRGRAIIVQDSGPKVAAEVGESEWKFILICNNPGEQG